jgi:hypothetical protein
LVQTPRKLQKKALLGFAATLVLMGGFLTFDIGRKLLLPRQFKILAPLAQVDMNQKNLLFVNDGQCFTFLQANPALVTEFNQLLSSRNVQLKRIKSANVTSVNLGAYDFVMGCRNTLAFPMQKEVDFRKSYSFMDGAVDFYENQKPRPYIYAASEPFALEKTENLADKARFAAQETERFDFVTDFDESPVISLQDPFEALRLENIQDDKVVTTVPPMQKDTPTLHVAADDAPPYYKVEDDRITFSLLPDTGFTKIAEKQTPFGGFENKTTSFAYLDKQRSRRNLIPNPSFEEGLWQSKVWDCYAYDERPVVSMTQNSKDAHDGRKSLELSAKRHIACSGPGKISVKQKSQYLLHFMYKSVGGSFAGYQITFDDEFATSLSGFLPAGKQAWTDFSRQIEVPPGAKHMELVVYGRQGSAGTIGTARYDDFTLYEIPDLQGKFYLTSRPEHPLTVPNVSFRSLNPTKKSIHVAGARGGFYLAMRDTYHPAWRLSLNTPGWLPTTANPIHTGTSHLKANGFMNMWYIDPAVVCQRQPHACQANSDGTYTMDMQLEFAPQRWFYAGLVVSSLTFIGTLCYFSYLGIKLHRRGGKGLWRLREG